MRILIVDFEFPEPDRSSGGHRLFELTRILAAHHQVSFLNSDYWQKWYPQDPKYQSTLEDLGVRCLFDKSGTISGETGAFIDTAMPDVAILCHYYIGNLFTPYLRQVYPHCRVILDTVDIHHVREERQKAVTGAGDPEAVRENEGMAIASSDRVWAITEADAKAVREWNTKIDVVPNIHPVAGPGKSFAERQGIVFVGNYIHAPNADAMQWFGSQVVPLLQTKQPPMAAGAAMPDTEWPNIQTVGWVPELNPFLQAARVGIAPLRFGSGMKGKIGDYLSCGLPCVTTSIGAEGMGLQDGIHCLIRDNEQGFAEAVDALCCDEDLWSRLSHAGLQWAKRYTPKAVESTVLAALQNV
jgi:hypothetical protein